MDDKDLYAGLIRLHILHHAAEEGAVYGLRMIKELGRHGYRLSPGTLYPILHGLERKGYLRSTREGEGSRLRRTYEATPAGRKALAAAKQRVWELFGELFEPARAKPAKQRPKQKNPAATGTKSAKRRRTGA